MPLMTKEVTAEQKPHKDQRYVCEDHRLIKYDEGV